MIGVVVNPLALRHLRDRHTTGRLARVLGGRGPVVETLSLAHLERVAGEFAADGVRHLAVSGGDGTLGTTLSAFRRAYGGHALPTVTPLRGGTMNTLSNGLGMPARSPERLLHALVDAVDRGAPLREAARASMLVDGERLAFLFGTGVTYGFLAEYYDAGASRPGPGVAATTLARLAASALVGGPAFRRASASVGLAVEADGAPWGARAYLGLLAGTVNAVGLGFRPFHLLEREPPAVGFHLLGLLGPASRIVARLPRARAGLPLGPDAALEALVEEARLVPLEKAHVDWFADGDLGRSEGATHLVAGPRVVFAWPSRV